MTPLHGEVAGANEVDDARWLGVEEARRMLTYERDLEVLARLS